MIAEAIEVKTLNEANFASAVLNHPGKSVVMFNHASSGAYQLIESVILDQIDRYGHSINFWSVDVTQNKKLARRYNLDEIPAFLFFNDGQLIGGFKGIVSIKLIERKFEALMNEEL